MLDVFRNAHEVDEDALQCPALLINKATETVEKMAKISFFLSKKIESAVEKEEKNYDW